MKAARLLSALVVFFLLFGLPTMIFIQFGRMQHSGGEAIEGENFISRVLRRLAPKAFPAKKGARKGRPSAGRTGAGLGGDDSGGAARQQAAGQAAPGGPDAAMASAGGVFGDEGRPVVSGRPDNGGMEELEGGPINDPRSGPFGRYNGGTQGLSSGGGDGAKDGGSQDPRGRRMRSLTGTGSNKGVEDSEHAAASRKERAETARVELNTAMEGENQANLVRTSVDSQQASNMAKKLHLLDGAKDHAGRQFDGNTKFRAAIPLEKYTDSFGNQAVRAKGDQPTVDLSP